MGGDIPVAYIISHDGDRLDISLIEIDRVLPHEETIPEMLQSLTERIRSDLLQKAPIIVERDNLVVLDGMHRLEALRRLTCRFICICLVDYNSPEIVVDRWCRTVSRPFSIEDASDLAEKLGLKISERQCCGSEAEKNLPLMIFSGTSKLLMGSSQEVSSSFRAVLKFEKALRERGNKIGYETEKRAMAMLREESIDTVICPPQIDKEQVIESAIKGRTFIFKSTRHIIPARPMAVNVPLSLLKDDSLSIEAANEKLSEMLRGRSLRHLQPGSSWNGRRYEEDLYIFV